MAGELGVCAEAVDRADLAEQLRGAERSAARQREQPRRDRGCAFLQLALEFGDRPVEAAAGHDQLPRDPHLRGLFAPRELSAQAVEPDGAVECAERDMQAQVELVQVPAQPLLGATSLVNEIVAVVNQQLQLAQRLFASTALRGR
jgi:hypothetical protein